MRYFPAFVDVHQAPVLVVGGAEEAVQKIRLMRKTSARIKVVAPTINAEIRAWVESGEINWTPKAFHPSHLDRCRLVFSTIGDRVKDAGVAFAARARSIPVNVVDVPQLCTFITPAIVDRDPVLIAIGTEGSAPVLAQKIKAMLEAWLPAQMGKLAQMAAKLRPTLATVIDNGRARRTYWRRFFDGPIANKFYGGDHQGAQNLALDMMSNAASPEDMRGRVSLVGAGPGDPDLLTFKAARALQQADVIVYDRLVDNGVLEIARRDARRIDVGKKPGCHSIMQSEINQILVDEANEGHYVVRLKGGDPLIFGRAAEEIDALQSHDISVDIIPGITAALASASRVGALLTERDVCRSLTIMTGHTSDGPAEHDWDALARSGQSIAIYMGVGTAARIQKRLLQAGINPQTKMSVIESASLPREKIVCGTIAELGQLIISNGINGPAIFLVGPRARLPKTVNIELREVA